MSASTINERSTIAEVAGFKTGAPKQHGMYQVRLSDEQLTQAEWCGVWLHPTGRYNMSGIVKDWRPIAKQSYL